MVVVRFVLGSLIAPTLLSLSPLAIAPTTDGILEELPSPTITKIAVVTPQNKAKDSSVTENYLPRRLYPGTYKNFCGPTPETQVKSGCTAHGWHGDDPSDRVDEACRIHDISYCNCETKLLSRQQRTSTSPQQQEDIPLLASMTALRFLAGTKPTLERTLHADAPFFECANQADRQLIATGITVRGEMQRSGCSIDPSLAWMCDLGVKGGTLDAFEKVNLNIFLRDLDADENSGRDQQQRDGQQEVRLVELEQRRQLDLEKELKNGKVVADAASSEAVQEDEHRILRKLLYYDKAKDEQKTL